MSGIIPIQIWNQKGFECCAQDTQCEYTSECTNHSSAGDFRMEYGMQPLLTIVDTDKMFLRCQTKDSPEAGDEPHRKLPSVCYGYGEILSLDQVNTNQLSLF